MKAAYFAGGCFWCVESDMKKAEGVSDVISGYMGDSEELATYDAVSSHRTKHREVVKVEYDETRTSFRTLTQWFLDHIDPTDDGGQFADRGLSYKTAIYFDNQEEEDTARGLLSELDASGLYSSPVIVDVLPQTPFYKAEEYHQSYSEKQPLHYNMYREGSGRGDFVNRTCRIREEKKMNWRDEK